MTAGTLLAGVFRPPRPHVKLRNGYKKILLLLQKLPKGAAYRINTEAIICHRLSVLNEAGDDIREIEDNISCGKIELLISQAEDELLLIQKMMVWQPWERLKQAPPQGQWDWPPAKV